MKKRLLILLILLVVGGFIYFTPKDAPRDVLYIGYVTPLSGDAATYGEPMARSAEIAAKEINALGGINGKRIQLIMEDSRCVGRDALSAVQKLISIDKVRIISGFTCAEDLLTAAPLLEETGTLALAPGASGPSVSDAGEYIFQVNPSATVASNMLATHIRETFSEVIVISEETGFALDVSKHFQTKFEQLEGEATIETYAPDTKDFRTIAAKIKQENPQAIFINPQTEIAGGLLMKQLREVGITSPFFSLDTPTGSHALEIAGDAAEGLVVVAAPNLDEKNTKAQHFLETYRKEYGEPPFPLYLAAAYDSIFLISESIKAVGENPEDLKNRLYNIPEYSGTVGTYRFDQNGDIIGVHFEIKKIINGQLAPVQ